ncbi:MAG: CHASE sensor domain-containing protein, partial [Verrucomicrobiota bacterium]
MEFLRNSPIKRKLTLLTMLTSGVALLLAAIAFIVFEAIDFRHALVEEVTTTAEMTGYNSSAALSFNEPASAEQALKSLGTHGPIVSAAIYDHEGQLFVSYQNANAREKFVPPPIEHNVHHFNENSVEVFRDIIFDNERVGTIYICHSLDEFWKRLWRYIFVVLLVMATASAVAYLLSNQLQAFISRPISHLSSVVGSVAFRKDYSLRALKEN